MAAYISLSEAKTHLRVEEDFTDDDAYIESCIKAAEEVVSQDICIPLSELQDEQGTIPAPLRQAMLMMLGTFYDSARQTIVFGSLVHKIPAYEHLIGLYRKY